MSLPFFSFNYMKGVAQHCEYLPALLFLYCLRCVINDHLSLQQHIPTSLSEAFSQAVSSTLESMRALCRRVLNDTTNVGGAEFSDLATTVALRANVDNQTSAMMSSEQSWSCMYFVALWRTFCSSHIQCKGAAHIWEELSSMTPASSQPHNMMTGSVGASSLTRLGLCYELGVGGVHKDFNKAVELYRRAADSGDATALCVLVGVCHHWNDEFGLYVRAAGGIYTQAACHCHGTPQAVTLLQQASDAGIAQAMNNLAACYERGLGVGRDIPKAVTLYQGAASAGHAVAMYNLGAFYFYGTGVVKDMDKAVSLWRRAAQLGNEEAIAKLRDNGKTESE
ncbi:calmodulin-dependent protein kinase [Pelomyxa schiedti]|nr:calmodulin-dependent protein kinase [Pelomyxa schiedti]